MTARRLTTSELLDLLELQKMRLALALDGRPIDQDQVLELSRKVRETRQLIAERMKKKEKKES
jgi:sulfur carrier protein ThiS